MAVDKIGDGRPVQPVNQSKKVKESSKSPSRSTDRVELSEEAKMLYATEKAQRLGMIRGKVESGFYDSPEVTEKVVEGLLRDIQRPPQA